MIVVMILVAWKESICGEGIMVKDVPKCTCGLMFLY